MLKIIAALLLVAYYAEGTTGPILHGSGIVTQKVGSVTLTFNYNDKPPTKFEVQRNDGTIREFKIDANGNCYIFDSTNENDPKSVVFGSPCNENTDKKQTSIVTVNDVTWLRSLYVTYNINAQDPVKPVVYTVLFAPDCKFPAPVAGSNTPIVAESIPLSRFVKEQQKFSITFAAEGADSTTGVVTLNKNGDTICKWTGIKLDTPTGDVKYQCAGNLEQDKTNNMRVFKQEFDVPTTTDVYTWITPLNGNPLSITVDGTQKGESSEMDGCRETTTSLAPSVVVSHIIVANLVLAMALL